MNLDFGNPQAFYLILAILALGILLFLRFRVRNHLIKHFDQTNASNLTWLRKRRILSIVVTLAALFFILLALARPQSGFEIQETIARGSDIFAVIDISNSMLAEDIKPNRLERAKRELLDLLGYLKGDRLGLIAFSGKAYVLCPLTNDYETLALFINDLDTDLISTQGTNISEALHLAFTSFDEGNPDNRAIFMITDGEMTEGDAKKLEEEAKKSQTRLYIMGMGNPEGAPIPQKNGEGFIKDDKDQIVLSKLNETNLKKFAVDTQGIYVRSVASDADIKALYVNGIKKTVAQREFKGNERRIPFEKYAIPLLVGFLLVVLDRFL